MDFTFSEEQEAARELAGRIFGEQATHERLKAVEQAAGPEGPFDHDLWMALADAGLLGLALPEDVGGAGLDFVATCLVVEAAGRSAAHVPVVETLVMTAGVLDRFGTEDQRHWWLPRIAEGGTVGTAALSELVGDMVVPGVAGPATTARRRPEGGYVLDGTKACVPAGLLANVVLVPAALVGEHGEHTGTALFLVLPHAAGVTLARQDTTAGRPQALMTLASVVVEDEARVGGEAADGAAMVGWLAEHATAALCVAQAGTCAAALELTADYTKTREQFDKPIATFQAVGQRAADAYVDTEAIRLTAWQAAWRLAAGLPASAEVAMAKFWAAEGGQRVVHAAAHLHGGVGVDRDYPLHRHFLNTRMNELTLGTASDSLRHLGALLAAEPA
jgi:acyl-CoA dehydrogenase